MVGKIGMVGMDVSAWIEGAYLLGGLVLPLFYLPQILRLLSDRSGASSYSLCKTFWQLVLRAPTLPFAVWVVHNQFMTVVLTMDLLGRLLELAAALHALRRQGVTWRVIGVRMLAWQRDVKDRNCT